ncbi:hypothetical protein IW140_005324 [Coemansia sp. RSA 1813]|nr:hypothetical protein EV178_005300 [Coemansia sp. RSA 1646]KAJ1765849.1 hypothetical protein LPJ74_006180 [Coemansia sp. RSA 1843]KAJ2087009.1 hypothetical protein IW138_005289 [Coemansia sp. RSA 986]KAJ2215572.1 hypothetical protein EV179_001982 [Coemansia sp. RSA 487]KAJ2565427.1 hypothetical protein IW140_005324 [Coemansia sp. RSA 1813]
MNRSSAYWTVLLLVFWVLLSWGAGQSSHRGKEERRQFERAWWSAFYDLSYPEASTYTSLPSNVRHRVDSMLNITASGRSSEPASAASTYFENVSGIYTGKWLAEHVVETAQQLPSNTSIPEGYKRPADKSLGRLTMALGSDEPPNKTLRLLHGTAHLQAEGYSAMLSLQGFYWSSYGSAVLYAVHEPNARAAIDLVRATPGKSVFAQAKSLYGEVMKERLSSLEQYEDVAHNCEYQFYMQFDPVKTTEHRLADNNRKPGSVDNLFEDSQFLQTIEQPSELQAQLIMYSPNCSVSIATPQGQSISGVGIDRYRRKTIHYALATLVVLLGQAVLLVCQMRHTPTPAALAKISYHMLSMQVIIDSFTFFLHMVGCLSFGNVYIVFAVVAFLAFMVLMMFEVRYLSVVWRLQRPDVSDATTGEGRRELWMIYLRFYIILIPGTYIFYAYLDGSGQLVQWLMCTMLFLTYSYWIPQIWRNSKRGTCRGLRKDYIVGVTLLRLFFPVYLFGYPGNIALHPPTAFVWVLCVYSIVQAAVLLLQDTIGPRFFVPKHLRPEAYDYHRPLPLVAVANNNCSDSVVVDIDGPQPVSDHPVSPGQDNALEQDVSEPLAEAIDGSSSPDCAICMVLIDSAVPSANQQERTAYMVTPCHHVYHTECLVQWMDIKLECPICRAPLPPV